ncbi:DUF7282 domain-containing protein [Halolamina salifodinae]|uniref:Blue (Type 1) copper domain protein n=1 Tax=Halolamina salifodinae TaxID=1202767 RepID=A0A8T4GTX1_9EURY|nr:plastocyanin/azurin family copper-binding protein [Halolamina salifodinae]MBP1986487.1 hypothetical protein [Halolamina salifodinae]
MSENKHTDDIEEQSGTVSRRTMLKATAAGGAVAATAGTASGQEDEVLRTYELIGRRDGWEGVSPSEIEGVTNPTLDMVPDETFEVVWENGDGIPHNFSIENEHGQTQVSTDLMGTEGETQSVTFTATSSFTEYFCQPHPQDMRGSIRIVDSLEGGGAAGGTLAVTIQNEQGEGVNATVTVDGTDKEVSPDSPTAQFLLSNGEYTVSVDPSDYYPTASQAVTIDGADAEVTITVASESGAYIHPSSQTSSGTVTVDSATLPEGGYVSVLAPTNFTNFDDGSGGEDPTNRELESFFGKTVFGASEYLGEGTHENVEIELNGGFDATARLVFMAHTDSGTEESLEWASSLGEQDVPYTFSGPNPVARDAVIEYVEPTPTPTPTSTATPTEEPTDEPTDTPTETGTTSTDSPGFGGLSALAGVGAGAAAAARRLAKGDDPEAEEE